MQANAGGIVDLTQANATDTLSRLPPKPLSPYGGREPLLQCPAPLGCGGGIGEANHDAVYGAELRPLDAEVSFAAGGLQVAMLKLVETSASTSSRTLSFETVSGLIL
jgi:hypothetical protein